MSCSVNISRSRYKQRWLLQGEITSLRAQRASRNARLQQASLCDRPRLPRLVSHGHQPLSLRSNLNEAICCRLQFNRSRIRTPCYRHHDSPPLDFLYNRYEIRIAGDENGDIEELTVRTSDHVYSYECIDPFLTYATLQAAQLSKAKMHVVKLLDCSPVLLNPCGHFGRSVLSRKRVVISDAR